VDVLALNSCFYAASCQPFWCCCLLNALISL